MLSELPNNREKAIQALEVKLAIARGDVEPDDKRFKTLIAWYDQQIAIEVMSHMPRGLYSKLSGRQHQVITNQSDQYGIPITTGNAVNLFKVLQFFHSFIQEWGPKIRANRLEKDRLSELAEKKIEAEIEAVNNKVVALQLDIEKKRGTAVPIAEVRASFTWLSTEWRKFGERLGKKYGAPAQRFLNDFLERLEQDAKNHMPGGKAEDQ